MNTPPLLDHVHSPMPTLHLFLLFLFVGAYVMAVGRLFGARGRRRSAIVALLAGIGVCVLTTPWMVGVLIVVGCVGGVGLFILVAMGLSRLFAPSAEDVPAQPVAELEALPAPVAAVERPQSERPGGAPAVTASPPSAT